MTARQDDPSSPLTIPDEWEKALAAGLGAVFHPESDRARTMRDAVTAFLVRVASACILYLSQIALARWMGSFEYGIYVFVWTWVLVLGGLSHLGLGMAMIGLIPQYRETGKRELLRGLLYGGRLIAVGVSSAVAGLGMLGLWLAGDHVASHYWLPAILALVCVPMCALTDVQDGIGRGRASMSAALLPPYVLRPLLLLLAMAAAHATGLPMEARTAAGAAIVATWLAAIVQTVVIERRLREETGRGPRQLDLATWLWTSLPLLVIGGCEIVLQNADVLVVSRHLGPTDVAIYYAAAKTMSLVLFVHYAVGSAFANRFAALQARGDMAGLRAFVRDAVAWTFWPSLAAAIGLVALGKPLLALFGAQFVDGYGVMLILVAGFLMRASMGPSELLLNMLGEQKLCAAVLATSAALDVALLFVLVPAFGLAGAASATALALTAASLLNALIARRRLALDISIVSSLTARWSSAAPLQ
jgi:O-antigen/teichoic acid export membrane protein